MVIALEDNCVEEQGFAKLVAVVGGALDFGFVVEEGSEAFFGEEAVGLGAGEVALKGADFSTGDMGDGDGGIVGAGAADEADSLIGKEGRFGQGGGGLAGGDEEQD